MSDYSFPSRKNILSRRHYGRVIELIDKKKSYEKSSPKNKSAKQFFSKSKERVMVECYELDQSRNKIILESFIKKHGLFFEKNTYKCRELRSNTKIFM